MYTLTLHAYCGMAVPHGTYDTLAEVRDVARHIRAVRARQGHPIVQLTIGREWEIGEPDGCGLVPDTAGILSIKRI